MHILSYADFVPIHSELCRLCYSDLFSAVYECLVQNMTVIEQIK
jgi:hypothetical protein